MKDGISAGLAMSFSPQKHAKHAASSWSRMGLVSTTKLLMGFSRGENVDQHPTSGAEPADNSSPAKLFRHRTSKGTERPRQPEQPTSVLSSCCRQDLPSCSSLIPNAGRDQAANQQAGGGRPFITAPLAIHKAQAIFGWAANLFLAAATSQTTTAEKSG